MDGRQAPAQAPVRAPGLHRRPVRRAGQGLPARGHRPLPGAPRGGRRQAGRGHGHGDLGAVRLPRQRPDGRVRPRPASTAGWPSSASWASARSSPCTSSTTRWAARRWTAAPPASWSTRATRSPSAASGTPGRAPGAETDNTQTGNGGALAGAVAGTPLQGVIGGQTPVYPPGPHCNSRGLTSLGRYMIDKLMDSEVDRGDRPHGRADAQPDAGHPREAPLLGRDLGTHVGVAAELPADLQAGRRGHARRRLARGVEASSSEWAAYRKLRDKRFYFGFGFGSDTNGLAVQGSPPDKPLAYPFTALDGKTKMDRQVTGVRTFDYNKEGVAHYGLYADWLADLRRTGGPQMAREMNRGAEAYLQMWERAEGIKQTTCRNATRGGHLAAAAGTRPAGRARPRTAAPRRPADRAARGLLPLVRQAQQGRGHRGVQQPLAGGAGDHDRPAPPLGQGRARAPARGRCAGGPSGWPRACTSAGA